MSIERSLTLPNQTIITDQQEIDRVLKENEEKLNHKKRTPPSKHFKKIDMFTLKIVPKKVCPLGHLQTKRDGYVKASEPIYPECDVTIDITPEARGVRAIMIYDVTANNKPISVEVLFDETSRPELRELDDPNNPEKIEPLIREELLDVIQEKKWRRGLFGGSWFAVK